MSFRKFFFSTTAMSLLLLPGITVSASAYSLSDRSTLYQNSSDDCEYYNDCTEGKDNYCEYQDENDCVEDDYYLNQEGTLGSYMAIQNEKSFS